MHKTPPGVTPYSKKSCKLLTPPRARDGLVSKRFAGLEGKRDAFLRLSLAAKADEGFALEIKDVLLGDHLRRRNRSARKNGSHFARHHRVVRARKFTAHQHVNGDLCRGQILLAEHSDLSQSRR